MSGLDSIAASGVKIGRKYFRDTWVQKLPITGLIYNRVVGAMAVPEVAEFRGVQLAIAVNDRTITPTLLTGDFERVELDVFEKIVHTGMVVVDVGANSGVVTALAARAVGFEGTVVAVEAVPDNVGLLSRTVELNGFEDRVHIEPCAAGADHGTVRIYLDGDNSGTHSVGMRSDTFVDVPVITVDALVAKHNLATVDVFKVDVEGYEDQVLQGAAQMLRGHQPIVFAEFDNAMIEAAGGNPQQFVETLEQHGELFNIDERSGAITPITARALLAYKDAHSSVMARNIICVPESRREFFERANS